MPALIQTLKFLGPAFLLFLILGWVGLVNGQGKLDGIKYLVQGSQRHLIIQIPNQTSLDWRPKVKVRILDTAGRVKHTWSFNQQIKVSAGKQAVIELKWLEDDPDSRLEKAEVYLLDDKGQWQLEAWAHSRHRGSFMTKMLKFLPEPISLVINWIKTFPNELVSFPRKEVSLDAQRSA